jgi:hypothetical protein
MYSVRMVRSAKFFLSTLLLTSPVVLAGTFTSSLFTDDATSGINSAVPYTAVVDFLGNGSRVVNGLTFSDTRGTGNNYVLDFAGNQFTGNANNVTGNSNGLLSDFYYGGQAGTSVLTLGGLTPGVQYTTTWYNVGFGAIGGRQVNITPSDTSTPFLFDQNFSNVINDKNGNILSYTFVANATSISYTFDAVIDADTFHFYAMTNSGALPTRSVATVTPVSTDAVAPGGGTFAPFTVSNTDLLQTSVASVSSSGNFAIEGTGGVSILNNGQFSITGVAGTNPQLATGQNNSWVSFNLDTSVNAFGYDVTSIAGYGGWNDAGRDRQQYSVFVSFIGDPTYLLLGTVDHDVPGGPTTPSASSSVFTPAAALTGVDGIRFEFLGAQENTYAGYGEFDVIGTASVPEPSTAMLLLGGFSAAAASRRTRRRS